MAANQRISGRRAAHLGAALQKFFRFKAQYPVLGRVTVVRA